MPPRQRQAPANRRTRLKRRLKRRIRRTRRRFARWRALNRVQVFHMYTVELRGDAAPAARPDAELVPADAASLTQLFEQHPDELPGRKLGLLIDRLTEEGQRSWVLVGQDGVPCGFAHASVVDTLNARIGHQVRMSSGQAYLFDDYVVRSHRRRGLHAFSIARRLELLAMEGVREGVVTIRDSNVASVASYAKFGARRHRVVLHFPLVGRTLDLPARHRRA